MKKHLYAVIEQHLGNFPLILTENSIEVYRYCPLPGIVYDCLDDEIFCHKYYLNNLCDQERFSEWHIEEPIEVFRKSIIKLKDIVTRSLEKERDKFEDARQVMGLKVGDNAKDLRIAFCALTRRLHPEKVRLP